MKALSRGLHLARRQSMEPLEHGLSSLSLSSGNVAETKKTLIGWSPADAGHFCPDGQHVECPDRTAVPLQHIRSASSIYSSGDLMSFTD